MLPNLIAVDFYDRTHVVQIARDVNAQPDRSRRPRQGSWRARRRSWICARSPSQRDRAWVVTSSHWRWTSSSAGRSPRAMRSSSSWTSRPAAAEPTRMTMMMKNVEIIAKTAPMTP